MQLLLMLNFAVTVMFATIVTNTMCLWTRSVFQYICVLLIVMNDKAFGIVWTVAGMLITTNNCWGIHFFFKLYICYIAGC